MVNAFETFANPNILRVVRKKGIHEFLDYEGPIFMDSGGFMRYIEKSDHKGMCRTAPNTL